MVNNTYSFEKNKLLQPISKLTGITAARINNMPVLNNVLVFGRANGEPGGFRERTIDFDFALLASVTAAIRRRHHQKRIIAPIQIHRSQ